VYQPQVHASGIQASVEALLRWHPDGRDAVPPDDFIPLAEELGLIGAIGAWVLREACRATAALHVRGLPVRVCVNLSPNQLADPGLSSVVAETLADAGLPPEQLELELTETALMEQGEDASARLSELRTLGVRISLDDFGTGYSSLARLQQLPLDALKIDRSFIAGIGKGSGTAIVGSIIELGHTLGLEVIAEGIETSEQRAIVQSLGVDRMQGYLIGRPTVELRPPQILGAW
jgi:EAL domain-containing protein (putative c-di-GMP-specific phosphodiesterase class I)